MQILMRKTIPQFFSALAHKKRIEDARDGSPYRVSRTRFLCLHCGAEFEVDIQPSYGISSREWDDGIISCPCCGKQHFNYSNTGYIGYCDDASNIINKGRWLPIHMELTVRESIETVTLRVKSRAVMVQDNYTKKTTRFEEFRFNVKTRVSTFCLLSAHNKVLEQHEIGNPFDNSIALSMLMSINSTNLSAEYKDVPREILTVMRKAIAQKWKKIHGYKLGSIFASWGPYYGKMLFPLKNIAFRLLFPDAKNLPVSLAGSTTDVSVECSRYYFISRHLFEDLSKFRGKEDNCRVLCRLAGIPVTPMILSYLHENIFLIDRIKTLLSILGGDQNYLPEAFKLIEKIREAPPSWVGAPEDFSRVLRALETVAIERKGKEVIHYLHCLLHDTNAYASLRDTSFMMQEASAKARAGAKKVKLKNLHDYLVMQRRQEAKEGYNLEVPEHIVRRLSMQLDQVKFFLPQKSIDLTSGGNIFHNCVGTYARRVKEGYCQIVFMTDDRGKLTACLEVRNNALVQAKLRFNRPVCENSAVNGAVVDWCEKASLRVVTHDVRKMRYPVPLEEIKKVS